MAITRQDIEKSLANGYNIFCATCVNLYQGREKGVNGCVEALNNECSGPLKVDTFPKYDGLIPRERFDEICLLCGDPDITLQVIVKGKHEFSLCHNDRKALEVLIGKDIAVSPILVPVRKLIV